MDSLESLDKRLLSEKAWKSEPHQQGPRTLWESLMKEAQTLGGERRNPRVRRKNSQAEEAVKAE